jgi:hypothetical protein
VLSRTNLEIVPVIDLSSIGNKGVPGELFTSRNAAGSMFHAIEFMMEFLGANLVTLAFSLSGRRLSAGIYKICTLLSTSFVENIAEGNHATARKALSGAVFGASAAAHWQCGR